MTNAAVGGAFLSWKWQSRTIQQRRSSSKKMAILLVLSLALAACSSGKHFTINDANKVTNGMTREEVIEIMGTTPYQITGQGKTFT